MKRSMIAAALALSCACGPRPQENPPVPKDPGSPAPSVAVSTPAAGALSAPANYVKRTTDQLGRAKAAAALYEDAAARRMDPSALGGE
ncbi:MAG TPA: hypothetical protein PK523_11010 [Elusimicrobiales bacterium]|nr:hypothetical protein [Elusimicrobiales bacterium]